MSRELMALRDFRPEGTTGPTPDDLLYHSEVTGPDGAHYILFREKRHGKSHVEVAKEYIRRNFDPVSIVVIEEID